MGSWHKLFKSKHCYFFKITLPWMKIWRWWCSSYLHNHGVLLCEKVQCLKCKDTEGIHKKLIFSFLEMRNCVWYLWTCPNEFMNMAITCFHLIQFWWNLDRTQWTEFYILWWWILGLREPFCFEAAIFAKSSENLKIPSKWLFEPVCGKNSQGFSCWLFRDGQPLHCRVLFG